MVTKQSNILYKSLFIILFSIIVLSSIFLNINKVHAAVKTGLIGENVEAEYNSDTETLTIRSINGVKGTIDRTMFAQYMKNNVSRFGGFDYGNHHYCFHETITFENPVYAPEDSSHLLSGNAHPQTNTLFYEDAHKFVTTINNLKYLDTSRVKDMSNMFCNSAVETIDISMWDTSNVTNMQWMFAMSNNSAGSNKTINISGIDTSNVTNMYYMFGGRRHLENLNISGIDTSKVTNMSYMFAYLENLEQLDLSHFNTSSVENMSYMFAYGKFKILKLSNFNTSKVTNMERMFASLSAETIDISSFDTENVTNMSYMFSYSSTKSIIGIEDLNVEKLEKTNNMFQEHKSLENIDLSKWKANKLLNADYMFDGCTSLKNLKLFKSNSLMHVNNMLRKCSKLEMVDARYVTPLKGLNYGTAIFSSSAPNLEDIYTFYGVPETMYDNNSYFGLPTGETYINIDDTLEKVYKNSADIRVDAPLHLVHGNLITLNTNGGIVNSGNINKYRYGEEAILPTDVTKDGYSFDGWYLESDFTGERQTKVLSTDTGLKTFYAKWNTVEYTIKYNLDGGNITGQKTTYTIEEDDFVLVHPTKSNAIFMGWISEDIKEPVMNVTVEKGTFGNKEFTATWQDIVVAPTQYTVKFMDKTSELISLEQQVNEGNKVTKPSDPEKTGFRFDNWYKESTFENVFDFDNETISGETKIYAKFIEQFIVNTDLNGGEFTLIVEVIPQDKGTVLNKSSFENIFKDTSKVTPPTDKEFDYIEIDGSKWTDDTHTLNSNITIKVIWRDKAVTPTYTIVSGANQTYIIDSNIDIVIKASGELAKLENIEVDGTVITSSKYKTESGSTILTLLSSYLNTLSVGDHTVTFVYNDGSVSTKLTVVKNNTSGDNTGGNTSGNNTSNNTGSTTSKTSKNTKSNNIKTGDNIMLYVMAFISSVISIVIGLTFINRKKLFNR